MPAREIQYLHISTWTLVRFFAIIAGIIFAYLLADIMAALFFGVIVASAVEPAIEWLKARRVPRLVGVVLIYLVFGTILFFVIYLVFPLLFDEVRNIAKSMPYLDKQLSITKDVAQISSLPFSLPKNLEDLLLIPSEYLKHLSSGVVDFAATVFGGIFSFFLIIIFSFYLAIQEKGIENFLRLIVPLSYEKYTIDLWRRSQQKLGLWFRSQLLLGAIVGVMIFFGLTFLGVEHALLFAAITAVFEIIPVAGPVLAAVPAAASAFSISPVLGLMTIILYIVVQQTESHIIIPVVMSRTVGLNALIIVLALLVGAKIGGVFGILLAVPLTTIMYEFLDDWNKKKRAFLNPT